MTTPDGDARELAWQGELLRGGTQSFEAWLASPRGGGSRAAATTARPLTPAEVEVVRAFNVAYRQLDLDRAVHREVVGQGIGEALRRRVPRDGESALETTPEAAWAEIGAAAAVGTLLVSGATKRRKRSRRHPAGAGFEPLEIARMSTLQLMVLYLRQTSRKFARRFRGRPGVEIAGAPGEPGSGSSG